MSSLLIASVGFANPAFALDKNVAIHSVERLAAFADDVQRVCQPHLRTVPPQSFEFAIVRPLRTEMATSIPGGYVVDLGSLTGTVRGETLTLTLSIPPPPRLPEDLPLWSEAEAIENARKVASLVCPSGYIVGETRVRGKAGRTLQTLTEFVTVSNPPLVLGEVDLTIDRATGAPRRVERRGSWPLFRPERTTSLQPVLQLEAEALRIHRSRPILVPVRLSPPKLVYAVPAFSRETNEMTDDHRRWERDGEAIPLYEWRVGYEKSGSVAIRTIYVDARTGMGVAVQDWDFPISGRKGTPNVPTSTTTGRWRVRKVEGSFEKAPDTIFEGLPVVVTNAKQEVLTLRFDAKSGLVRDDRGTYRPDRALLAALRAEGPVKPFGRSAAGR